MKTKLTALALVAVTAFSLAPKPAKAGDKELAVVGGLIGGLIIGSAIADSRHSDHRDSAVVVDYRGGHHDRDRGYWKTVSVKVWVPGRWIIERSRYGRDYRRYVDGHYTFRTDRVWVSYDRHDRRDHHDRYDRHDYGRGR
jgi:hypothetical protein